jgi:penicillin-binding protein 1A
MVVSKTGAKKSKKKKRSKVFRNILLTLLSIIVVAAVAGTGVVLAIIKTAPKIDVNAILSLSEPSKIYDDKGEFIDNVNTSEHRTVISFKEMPKDLQNAFVSIEDERFYKHHGIDIRRIVGAAFEDVANKIKRKPGLQGASTITQQLIKNTVLTPEATFKRKIQEAYLAIELEKYLSKDQILEAYMNTIQLGGNTYGVEAASIQYFNKSANQLNLTECAFIAGVTQNPTLYYLSAFGKKDSSYFINRTKLVLDKMYENNYISKEQYDSSLKDLNKDSATYKEIAAINTKKTEAVNAKDKASKSKNTAGINKADAEIANYDSQINKYKSKLVMAFKKPSSNSNRLGYEWFSLPVIEQVKKDLKSQYNYSDAETVNLLMYGGLKIYTTMDKKLQDYAQGVLDDDRNLGITSSKDKSGIIQPQASAVIMDYHTGEVKVIIGGRGEQPAMSYNRAASNKFLRPSGSSIKPLTVYSPAIDTRQATAATVIEDSPLPEEIGRLYPVNGKPYNPSNYDSEGYKGYVNLRTAITYSINLVAIKLENQIGLKTGADYAEKFGLKLDAHDKTSIAALALGQLHVNTSSSNPSGVNTLTMAAAYGTFGNDGNYTSPILYSKVIDRSGKVILESKVSTRTVLSPESSYIMYDLLKGPVESPYGTAPNAKLSSMPSAGKTGTSGDKKDFWFCGLTPYYSGAVWIGNDYPTSYYNIYSSTSAGLWAKIMEEANKNLPRKDVTMPSDIVTASVCRDSGKLPTDACTKDPRGDRTYQEMFIPGTVPTDMCDTHVEAKINKLTGKLATKFTLPFLVETKVYIKRDYTPSVYLDDEPYVVPKELDNSTSEDQKKNDNTSDDNAVNNTDDNNTTGNNSNTTEDNTDTQNNNSTETDNNTTPKKNKK